MLTLTEIQQNLENPSIQKRKNFIEKYDFLDNNTAFYFDYIQKNLEVSQKDTWYLIALVELAEDLEFFEKSLIEKNINLYYSKKSVYLKLTILDYLSQIKQESEFLKEKYLNFLKKSKNELLKNQILCNLIKLFPHEKSYQNLLLSQIPKIKEYHSLLRILVFFGNNPLISLDFSEKLRLETPKSPFFAYESVKQALKF